MGPQIKYPNARLAAYAVKKLLDGKGSKVTARPWNKFDPDNTLWWIVPHTEWPAYRWGKFFFSPDHAPKDFLFCGLHMEKGLDPRVADAYPSRGGKSLIMRDDWAWHSFLGDLRSGVLNSAVKKAAKAMDEPILIRVETGYAEDPGSFDPHAIRFKWDKMVFSSKDGSLKLKSHDAPSRLLGDIAGLQRLEQLAGAIEQMKDGGWYWIDISIGSLFERASEPLSPNALDVGELYSTALPYGNPGLCNSPK